MKMKYSDTYTKRTPVVVNGVPVVENGKVVVTKKRMYVYAITSATPEELVLYKRFKRDNPDGNDYYRESDNGIPLWHDGQMYGLGELQIDMYKDRDGKMRFKVNDALRGALEGIREQTPSLGEKVDDALFALMTTGAPVDVAKLTSPVAKQVDEETIVEVEPSISDDETPEDLGGGDETEGLDL